MKVGITLKEGTGAFTKECGDYSANFIADEGSEKVAYNSTGKCLELVSKNGAGDSRDSSTAR